jgi:hypothetical protein
VTFARVKPAGWTDDVDVLTATQANTIDTNQSNAVDGAAGGTYTPSGDLSVASLKSPSLKETTVIESLILGTLSRLVLTPTDVTVLGIDVNIRDIDAGNGGVLFRVDDSGSSATPAIIVAADTTANIKDGETIIIFFQGAGVVNVNIESEGATSNNPIYTRTGGAGVDPEWVVLCFNTGLTGDNADGEWELAMSATGT